MIWQLVKVLVFGSIPEEFSKNRDLSAIFLRVFSYSSYREKTDRSPHKSCFRGLEDCFSIWQMREMNAC